MSGGYLGAIDGALAGRRRRQEKPGVPALRRLRRRHPSPERHERIGGGRDRAARDQVGKIGRAAETCAERRLERRQRVAADQRRRTGRPRQQDMRFLPAFANGGDAERSRFIVAVFRIDAAARKDQSAREKRFRMALEQQCLEPVRSVAQQDERGGGKGEGRVSHRVRS